MGSNLHCCPATIVDNRYLQAGHLDRAQLGRTSQVSKNRYANFAPRLMNKQGHEDKGVVCSGASDRLLGDSRPLEMHASDARKDLTW
jgi:hypothetical protein